MYGARGALHNSVIQISNITYIAETSNQIYSFANYNAASAVLQLNDFSGISFCKIPKGNAFYNYKQNQGITTVSELCFERL